MVREQQSGELAAKQGRLRTEVTEKAKPPRATETVDSASREVVHFISPCPLMASISETSVRNLSFLLVHPIALPMLTVPLTCPGPTVISNDWLPRRRSLCLVDAPATAISGK
jgi:hypothetical protein